MLTVFSYLLNNFSDFQILKLVIVVDLLKYVKKCHRKIYCSGAKSKLAVSHSSVALVSSIQFTLCAPPWVRTWYKANPDMLQSCSTKFFFWAHPFRFVLRDHFCNMELLWRQKQSILQKILNLYCGILRHISGTSNICSITKIF